MSTFWYSFVANIELIGGKTIDVYYYFSVDNITNNVTGFYSYQNMGVNLLLPKDGSGPEYFTTLNYTFDVNNLMFTYDGLLIRDKYLGNQPLQLLEDTIIEPQLLAYPVFNIYSNPTNSKRYIHPNWLNVQDEGVYDDNIKVNKFDIKKISSPFALQWRFSDMFKPLYSDNSRVYYKPGSLPSCGVGTVRNSSMKSKKI